MGERIDRQLEALRDFSTPEHKTLSGVISDDYDEFYYTGIEYYNLSVTAILKAARKYEAGEAARASALLNQSYKYEYLARESFNGANQVRRRHLAKAETVAEMISNASQAVSTLGLEFVGCPTAAKTVDYLFLFTEEGARSILLDEPLNKRRIVKKIIIEETFDHIHWEMLDGHTLSEAIEDKTSKVFPLIKKLVGSKEWENKIVKALIKKSLEIAGEQMSKEVAGELANQIAEELESEK